jgi:two-component system, OmpR family, phosphate regulon response regulator OmpR
MRVLLLDDDDRLTAMLKEYLGRRGVEADIAGTVAQGLERLRGSLPDALVLDVMLPDGDGFDVLRTLRAGLAPQLPIVMLTARGEPTDRIVGLEMGADDYLAKPFDPRELLARLRAVLRRTTPPAPERDLLRFGSLEIDRGRREVRLDGDHRDLTSHQFDLLVVLAERSGRVLSREQMLDLARGDQLGPFDRSIDVHISRIRAAIEVDPKHPTRIKTVRGVGYVFVAEQA